MVQTVDSFNPNSNNTHIESDGPRITDVVQRYREITVAPVTPQAGIIVNVGTNDQHPCDLRTQTDSSGRPCGERAAEAKPGGRTGHKTDYP
jgi:hypothetical protein